MSDQKEIPRAELSLKYMAWDVKQLSKNVEKLVNMADSYFTFLREEAAKKASPEKKAAKYSQEEIPF